MTRDEMVKALADWHYADMVADGDYEAIALMAKNYIAESYEDEPLTNIEAEYAELIGANQ